MRLSGDRRSTLCAGQHRGSTSSKPRLLTPIRELHWGFVYVLFLNSTFCSFLHYVPAHLLFIFNTSKNIYLSLIKVVFDERLGKKV